MTTSTTRSDGDPSLEELLASFLPPEDVGRAVRALYAHIAEALERYLASGKRSRDERLWTPRDVQQHLGVSARKLDYLIEDGEIVPIWIGRQRRFHPDAIRAYVRAAASASGR